MIVTIPVAVGVTVLEKIALGDGVADGIGVDVSHPVRAYGATCTCVLAYTSLHAATQSRLRPMTIPTPTLLPSATS